MSIEPLFTGICTALVTPFRDGRIDFLAFDRLIDRQLIAGIPALLVCGTTGEPSALSEAEWQRLLAHAVVRVNGRALVIAGTGSNNLTHTLSRARIAAELGANAQLAVTPYYNKTTQPGLVAFFSRIADETALPLFLYNVPARTGLNMTPETAAKLQNHARIVGIKEASGSLNQLHETLRVCSLPLYCGSDEILAPALQLGACGAFSVLSNLFPKAVTQLYTAVQKKCFATANARQTALSPLIEALFAETSPAPIKAALAMLGLCTNEVRPPLVPVQESTLEALKGGLLRENALDLGL